MKGYEKLNRRISELMREAECDYVDEETDDMNPIEVMNGDVLVNFQFERS